MTSMHSNRRVSSERKWFTGIGWNKHLVCIQAQSCPFTSLQTLTIKKQMFSNKCKVEAIKQSRYSISHSLENSKSTLHIFKKTHIPWLKYKLFISNRRVKLWRYDRNIRWCFKVWGKKTWKKTLHHSHKLYYRHRPCLTFEAQPRDIFS